MDKIGGRRDARRTRHEGGVGAYVTGTELDWPASVLTLNGTVNGLVVAGSGGARICISVPVR